MLFSLIFVYENLVARHEQLPLCINPFKRIWLALCLDGAMKFKTVQAWWQEMAKLNTSSDNLSSGLAILPSSADNCSSESYNKGNCNPSYYCHLLSVSSTY